MRMLAIANAPPKLFQANMTVKEYFFIFKYSIVIIPKSYNFNFKILLMSLLNIKTITYLVFKENMYILFLKNTTSLYTLIKYSFRESAILLFDYNLLFPFLNYVVTSIIAQTALCFSDYFI